MAAASLGFMLDDLPKVTHINPLGANGTLDKVIGLIRWRFSARPGGTLPNRSIWALAIQNVSSSTRIIAGLFGFFTFTQPLQRPER